MTTAEMVLLVWAMLATTILGLFIWRVNAFMKRLSAVKMPYKERPKDFRATRYPHMPYFMPTRVGEAIKSNTITLPMSTLTGLLNMIEKYSGDAVKESENKIEGMLQDLVSQYMAETPMDEEALVQTTPTSNHISPELINYLKALITPNT